MIDDAMSQTQRPPVNYGSVGWIPTLGEGLIFFFYVLAYNTRRGSYLRRSKMSQN